VSQQPLATEARKKDGNGDLLADSHNILNRLKNYFSRLLNVHNGSDVRHKPHKTTQLIKKHMRKTTKAHGYHMYSQ
jgi:hypothetical protein